MGDNAKPLRFTIEIFNAQFVSSGSYFLMLRIVGSKVKRSKVKLYVGNSDLPLEDHQFTTDACFEDGDPETLMTFTDSVITFWLPPESADGDIQLIIEAYRLPENPMHEGDKCGEAVFSVFPRRRALFSAVRQSTPSTKDSNELYQFETNITLNQAQEDQGLWITCGTIRVAMRLVFEEEAEQPIQEQDDAESLANFLPGSREVESKERRTLATDVENEEVILVWEKENHSRDTLDRVSNQQTGNLFDSSDSQIASGIELNRKLDADEATCDKEERIWEEKLQPPVCIHNSIVYAVVFTICKRNYSMKGLDREFQRTEPPKKPQTLPISKEPKPGPSTTPDTPAGFKTIQESALGSHVNSIPVHHLCGSNTAREGKCEVAVLIHGALGLPMKSDGRAPQPYIVGKSRRAVTEMQMGQSVTHAVIQPTHSPSWEELLLTEVHKDEANDEAVILLMADHPSKELLTEYKVPLSHLKPFHQYHLELVQPNSELSGDTRLYITLMKKLDMLPLPSVEEKIYGLEVKQMQQRRIVNNWRQYKEIMLSAQPRPAGVTVTTIHFPSPHPTSFAIAGAVNEFGAPQLTTAAEPQEQPQWNQTLFFLGDKSSLFTAESALVLEYYPASLAMSRDCWQLTSPVCYSYQTMDQLLLSSLQWDSAKMGLRVDNLPVEGSNLRTAVGLGPTVSIVLRLVTDEKPDQLWSAAHLSSLPVFREGPQISDDGEPLQSENMRKAEQTHYGLPPMNAVKTILPQFHSLYTAPRTLPVKEYVPLGKLSPQQGTNDASGSSQIPLEVRGKLDANSLAVMDYQMKEVDRYRTAMRKMAADLLHVREDCKRLEEANSRLRRELGQHDEISRLMVSSKDLDNVTHSELVQKFVLLKKKLADESAKKQEMNSRLQHLQNDLIKGKVQKAQTIQDTCKKQEKVIVQLEQLLAKKGKGPYNGVSTETGESYRTLNEENIRLQAEVLQYKEQLKAAEAKLKKPRSPGEQQVIGTSNGPMSDMERLELFEKLEKAEGRIVALEKQVK
ncbi:Coiled-coil domain-containing protein 33 [Stylophora pistillata]|uniref:Coiled-coil domain-containing protein 33 n=1 Tax=Stylophora pistillata TaxID=50429 RepID=A0A2B4SHR4_STYPI|nr:Coiled-coil domain-containing protein 33 [Stylophora pistillata]